MKIIYRLFAAACLTFTGLAGCAADRAPASDENGIESASQATVVRYGAADLAALGRGELLHVDLTEANTVYLLQYSDPADLHRVLVVRLDGEYVLGDRVPAVKVQSDTVNQVILAADPELAAEYAELTYAEPTPPAVNDDDEIGTAEQALKPRDLCCVSCTMTDPPVCTACKTC